MLNYRDVSGRLKTRIRILRILGWLKSTPLTPPKKRIDRDILPYRRDIKSLNRTFWRAISHPFTPKLSAFVYHYWWSVLQANLPFASLSAFSLRNFLFFAAILRFLRNSEVERVAIVWLKKGDCWCWALKGGFGWELDTRISLFAYVIRGFGVPESFVGQQTDLHRSNHNTYDEIFAQAIVDLNGTFNLIQLSI